MQALQQAQFEDARAERTRQAERQARLDQQAENEHLRSVSVADEARAYDRGRDRVADERYASEQAQKALEHKDAAANRYLDTERGYFEADKKREYDAAEAAKDRAADERRARISAAGSGGHDKPTQGQQAADSFYGRAQDALNVVEDVEASVSSYNSYIPNFFRSDAGQAYEQGKLQWIESYLRKDSGAAISSDEYSSADKKYFAQPGDSAATLKRKREARRTITETLRQQGTGKVQPMASHGNGNGRGGSRYKVTVE